MSWSEDNGTAVARLWDAVNEGMFSSWRAPGEGKASGETLSRFGAPVVKTVVESENCPRHQYSRRKVATVGKRLTSANISGITLTMLVVYYRNLSMGCPAWLGSTHASLDSTPKPCV
jgi:hypothetical protein